MYKLSAIKGQIREQRRWLEFNRREVNLLRHELRQSFHFRRILLFSFVAGLWFGWWSRAPHKKLTLHAVHPLKWLSVFVDWLTPLKGLLVGGLGAVARKSENLHEYNG